MSNMINGIIERRSIRDFKEERVPRDILELIIKAASYAPTARNRQCWHFTVIDSSAVIDRITAALKRAAKHETVPAYLDEQVGSPNYRVGYNASVLVIVSGDPAFSTTINDCALAAGNIMLAAHSLGLGSCWIHRARQVFESPRGIELLKEWGIEGDYVGIGHLVLGYAKGDYPKAKPRKAGYVRFIE